MPVRFIEQTGSGLIGFWEITETREQLMSMLSPGQAELESYLLFRNEQRKKEWLATRLLLREMMGSQASISYNSAGKPIPDNFPGHLSISHSAGFVTICHHPDKQPGIDIESIHRNTVRAAGKFLSPKELADCTADGQLSNIELLLRWCAKEAVFKMVPGSDIDFAGQIATEAAPMQKNEGEMSATFSDGNEHLNISLSYRIIGDMLMVWGTI